MRFWDKIIYRKYLPSVPYQEDIYLVSFPKSGNTWLRFLLATAIKLHYKIHREVNFFSIHDVIPDIYVSKNIESKGILGISNLPRIIKSHSNYNPYYHRVILLVRDPRDVIVSYYHYLNNYGIINSNKISLEQFINHKKYGVKTWLSHTESWLRVNNASQIIRFFRYEDLVQNPHDQICQMLDLIGIEPDSDKVKQAINLCSKENMQQSETRHMSQSWISSKKTAFVRKAKVGKGSELTTESRKYIKRLTQNVAKELGYDKY